MKQSTYPLELLLGMKYYASDAEGIGGKLRSGAEDFIVEEIPLPEKGGTGGPYLICMLTKTNWELQHAIKEIAKRLGISHRRIGWAGTKDRNAITRQRISLYNVTAEQVAEIWLKDIILEPLGQVNEALSLGDLKGNRFDILIRDTDPSDRETRVRTITDTVCQGIPNYFGIQRFGATRPVTHLVGEWILKRDFEKAVVTYIGKEFPGEPENVRMIRTAFSKNRDIRAALHDLPPQMSYERAMLHYLYTHPEDYSGALLELPPKLLSMFVSAFQSYLFNSVLSQRIDDGHSLNEPHVGDRLIFANGRTDTVTTTNSHAVSLHIRRGRCTIALFMPGKDQIEVKSEGDLAMGALLDKYDITADDFRDASTFVHTKFDGAWRSIVLKTAIESQFDKNNVRLKFSLPPGHYATTVCREYMKADPVTMI
ncbi:MAG: tRNA pseudouridine(13) synthase TruD [Methanoregula sp.]|jgi:tRNA pseudouridine13 synthase|nr:tRNA pseudouridine(13) synthase TruD [Methanoregula sp.]